MDSWFDTIVSTMIPVIGYFNNWNIIKLSQKSTKCEAFEYIHEVVLYGISDNMFLLVQYVKYGDINTIYTETTVLYVIEFFSGE